MTKKQVVWLIIRLIGLCSLFNALRYLLFIFESMMLVSGFEVGKAAVTQGGGIIVGWITEAIIFFAIAGYLLSNGKVVFELLDRE